MSSQPISRTIEINDLSPKEAAAIFASWGGDGQAEFFGCIARYADEWQYGRSRFCLQASHIAAHLDADGRFIIERIADHAGLIPDPEAE